MLGGLWARRGHRIMFDFSGPPAQVFYCGGDVDAKQRAAQLIEDLDFKPVDCGPLANARYLEALAVLWIQLAFVEGRGPGLSFHLVRHSG